MVTYTQTGEDRTHKTTPTGSTENLDELVKIYIVYTEDHSRKKTQNIWGQNLCNGSVWKNKTKHGWASEGC